MSRTSKSKDIITGEVALSDVDQTVLSIIPNPLAKEYHGMSVCTQFIILPPIVIW